MQGSEALVQTKKVYYTSNMRSLAIVLILTLATCSSGQVLEVPLIKTDASKVDITHFQDVEIAEVLLASGLPVLATEIYADILLNSDISPELERRVRIGLVRSYLAQDEFESAKAQIRILPEDEADSSLELLNVLVSYGSGKAVDWKFLGEALKKINASALSPVEQFWYFLMEGLYAEEGEDLEAAERYLKAALSKAQNAYQRANLKAVLLRESLRGAALESSALKEIERDLKKSRGAAAFTFAKQYALALWHSGKVDDALDWLDLDKQLKRYGRGFSLAQREELRLMRAMMLGESSTEGQLALAELIRSGGSVEVMEVALYLLSRQSEASVVFTELVNEILEQRQAHPLMGQMYYLRSQVALRRGELELAKADAEFLLEKFPGLIRILDAYFILAYAALRDESPQYRTAANFLIQHRESLEEPDRIIKLNILIGDCYYLNGDYANAAEFYDLALSEGPNALGSIFLRVVITSLRIGNLEDALRYIDSLPLGNSVSAEKRWQAEWNIAHALIKQQRAQDAIRRIRSLLASEETVSSMLYLRMLWLEISLALELGEARPDALAQVELLLDQHAQLDNYTSEVKKQTDLLAAELLLLKARVLYQRDESKQARETLGKLRGQYPASMAAQRSYIFQASELELLGNLEAAQAVMLELAEIYPQSPLAPQSIFEGALICERRGVDFYVEAIQLYERLADRFPSDAFLYAARMRQGDLLRLLNDFAGAQMIYETLINSDPGNPQRPVAELARAQCMLALAKKNPAKLGQASSSLERLVDMPNLDLNFRVEAMFKWAFALKEHGFKDRALEVLAESVARNLLDVKLASTLNASGRYWAGRTLLNLGEYLTNRGDFTEAKTVYRKLIAYNLPGRGLAQSRINSIQIINN